MCPLPDVDPVKAPAKAKTIESLSAEGISPQIISIAKRPISGFRQIKSPYSVCICDSDKNSNFDSVKSQTIDSLMSGCTSLTISMKSFTRARTSRPRLRHHDVRRPGVLALYPIASIPRCLA